MRRPTGETLRNLRKIGGLGILNEGDLADFNRAELALMAAMLDGAWRTRDQVCEIAGRDGRPAAEGTRRLRAVREALQKVGGDVECERFGERRDFRYRLRLPKNRRAGMLF